MLRWCGNLAHLCHLCTGTRYEIQWLHALLIISTVIVLDVLRDSGFDPWSDAAAFGMISRDSTTAHAKGVHNVLETHELREGTPMGPKKHQLKATDIRGTETEQWPSQVSGRSIFQKNIHKNPRESRRCSVANLRTTVPSSLQKLEVYDIINWFTTLYI